MFIYRIGTAVCQKEMDRASKTEIKRGEREKERKRGRKSQSVTDHLSLAFVCILSALLVYHPSLSSEETRKTAPASSPAPATDSLFLSHNLSPSRCLSPPSQLQQQSRPSHLQSAPSLTHNTHTTHTQAANSKPLVTDCFRPGDQVSRSFCKFFFFATNLSFTHLILNHLSLP